MAGRRRQLWSLYIVIGTVFMTVIFWPFNCTFFFVVPLSIAIVIMLKPD